MLTSIRFFIYGMYIYEYHSLHQHTASTSQFQNQYESFTSLLSSTDNMRHFFFKQLTIFRVNVMSLSKRNFGPTPPLWFPFFDTHERETGTIMKKGQWRFPWVRCSCELVFVNRVLSTTVSLSMRNCQSLPPKLRLRGHNCTLSMIIVQLALLRAILNWKNA